MQAYKQLLQAGKDKITDSLLKLPEGAQPSKSDTNFGLLMSKNLRNYIFAVLYH